MTFYTCITYIRHYMYEYYIENIVSLTVERKNLISLPYKYTTRVNGRQEVNYFDGWTVRVKYATSKTLIFHVDSSMNVTLCGRCFFFHRNVFLFFAERLAKKEKHFSSVIVNVSRMDQAVRGLISYTPLFLLHSVFRGTRVNLKVHAAQLFRSPLRDVSKLRGPRVIRYSLINARTLYICK